MQSVPYVCSSRYTHTQEDQRERNWTCCCPQVKSTNGNKMRKFLKKEDKERMICLPTYFRKVLFLSRYLGCPQLSGFLSKNSNSAKSKALFSRIQLHNFSKDITHQIRFFFFSCVLCTTTVGGRKNSGVRDIYYLLKQKS